MADIEIVCQNFTGAYANLNGVHRRNVSWRAFFRAVFTVGFQRSSGRFWPGWRHFFHRFGIGLSAFSFLQQSGNDLCLSPEHGDLDMSEKAAASYWHGMIFAKLVAESMLSVPWLAHVDPMLASGAITTSSASNERGDLVGTDINNHWHVIEAKGRSSHFTNDLVIKAKTQAASVTLINGQSPHTASACIASLFSQPISILLDDPRADRREKKWNVNDGEFFRQYYRGIIGYLRESGSRREHTIGNAMFLVAPLSPFYWDIPHLPRPFRREGWDMDNLELGLLAGIFDKPENAFNAVKSLSEVEDNGKVGSDGIAIFGRMPEWKVS